MALSRKLVLLCLHVRVFTHCGMQILPYLLPHPKAVRFQTCAYIVDFAQGDGLTGDSGHESFKHRAAHAFIESSVLTSLVAVRTPSRKPLFSLIRKPLQVADLITYVRLVIFWQDAAADPRAEYRSEYQLSYPCWYSYGSRIYVHPFSG